MVISQSSIILGRNGVLQLGLSKAGPNWKVIRAISGSMETMDHWSMPYNSRQLQSRRPGIGAGLNIERRD